MAQFRPVNGLGVAKGHISDTIVRVMADIAWQTAYSVDTDAPAEFAWTYLANVSHWDDPPAQFELEGPFESGSRGITRMPGHEPRSWFLLDVQPMTSYTIETRLDRALLWFVWRFDAISEGRTRLTQTIILKGDKASDYIAQVQPAFSASLPPGMNRIAGIVGRAYAQSRAATD